MNSNKQVSRSVTPVPEIRAGAPLGVILDALARAGWGPFHGRYYGATRAILQALGALLGPSGQGDVTAGQVADAAGYSELWTRRKLHELEEAGILTWDRGGVQHGRPTAGFIRVSKTALADLTNRARQAGNPKALDRARETAKRIAAAGLRFTKRAARRPVIGPTETKQQPPPLKREEGGRCAARPITHTTLAGPRPAVGARSAALRALLATRAPVPA